LIRISITFSVTDTLVVNLTSCLVTQLRVTRDLHFKMGKRSKTEVRRWHYRSAKGRLKNSLNITFPPIKINTLQTVMNTGNSSF